MKLIIGSHSIFDLWGKKTKDNAPEPNIIKDLEQTVGSLNEISNKSLREDLKNYIEYFHPHIQAHMLLEFSFHNRILYYSHLIWSGDFYISESFIDLAPNLTSNFVITNSRAGRLFLENPQKIAQYAFDVEVYKDSKDNSSITPPLFEPKLKLFGIYNPANEIKNINEKSETQLFPKEPTVVYYQNVEAKKKLLSYQFTAGDLEYLKKPNILNNILNTFSQ